MTGFPVSEGTFLEAPCKAFWFARAYHQGNLHVNNESDFFIFYMLPMAQHQQTNINKLTSTAQTAFSGQALIVMGENWLMKEGVYLYDKNMFHPQSVLNVLILESCTT